MRNCCLLLILTLAFLTGCFPFPHTSERFPGMNGRIVDAVTRQPVPSAIVSIHDHPSTVTKTDASGTFHFSKRRNYHLGLRLGICATSWPEGSDWSNVLDVTQPAYEARQVDVSRLIIRSYDDQPYELRDIWLTPK